MSLTSDFTQAGFEFEKGLFIVCSVTSNAKTAAQDLGITWKRVPDISYK